MAVPAGVVTLLHAVEVLGMVAFAASGFVEARRKGMDIVGVFTVAFITAFGGGTLRDILLDRRPLFWMEQQEYPIAVFLLALIVTPFIRHLQSAFSERVIVTADAIGLGLFSALGTSYALDVGVPVFVCVMMGVVTGIFGGVLRDVICNEIPLVFKRGHLYATCSFTGCWVYLILIFFETPQAAAMIASIVVTVALRLAAVKYNLRLPG